MSKLKDIAQGNGFVRLLSEHNKGRMVGELSGHLEEVVRAVRETGKSGEVKLTIKVKKEGREAMSVMMEAAPKIPQEDREASLFFANEEGMLSRTPFEQLDWVSSQEEAEQSDPSDRKSAAAGE